MYVDMYTEYIGENKFSSKNTKEIYPWILLCESYREEGLKRLATLCSIDIKVTKQGSYLQIPQLTEKTRQLLKAVDIRILIVLSHRKTRVVTRKKTA